MATPTKEIKKVLLSPILILPTRRDFAADELAVVKQVRTFMETKVAPIITKLLGEDSFPVLNCWPVD